MIRISHAVFIMAFLALLTCCLADTNCAMLVISYDDGMITDYTRVFPVHQKHDVPAELCVVSGWVDTEGHVTREQLQEMQAAGFEIVSHGMRHETLQTSILNRQVARGDTTVYSSRADRFHAGTRCVVRDGNHSEYAVVKTAGRNEKGCYVIFEDGVESSYPIGSIVRITDNEAIRETGESKAILEGMGLNVKHYSYPYTCWSDWGIEIVWRYYISGREGGGISKELGLPRGINTKDKIELSRLNCTGYQGELARKPEKRAEFLNAVVQHGGFGYLMMHSDNVSAVQIENLIGDAKRHGIDIVTRSEALRRLGIVFE